jgi:hypothetical protein
MKYIREEDGKQITRNGVESRTTFEMNQNQL